jgi:NADP-dependent 3-hydroxy acid dehydrogenase YdfG
VGRAIALALSEAGAAVAVCARSEDEIAGVAGKIASRQGRARAIRCDVTHRQEVEYAALTHKDPPVVLNRGGFPADRDV